MTDPARSVGHHVDTWAPSYDAQIPEMVLRYERSTYGDVGVLVAWREERST